MNVDANIARCQLLQSEYMNCVEKARAIADASGSHTKDSLKAIEEAARAKIELSKLTLGKVSEAHMAEAARLTETLRSESVRLGFYSEAARTPPPAPQPAPAKPAPARSNPTGAYRPSDAPKSAATENDEVGKNFSIDKFIFHPGSTTLDDYHSYPDLVKKLRGMIDDYDFNSLYPVATDGWGAPDKQNYLFFGPSGTGKSFLCSAIANYLKQVYPGDRSVFLLADCTLLSSRFVGTTGHILEAIFNEAARHEFSIICLDEIDRLGKSRDNDNDKTNYTENLLTLIDGVRGRCKAVLIGTTNLPWAMDFAMLDRLPERVFIDYPSETDIRSYFSFSKARRDWLGTNQEDRARMIAVAAKLTSDKHFSYRELNTLSGSIREIVERKTKEKYPEGNPSLEHVEPISETELRDLIAKSNTLYDAEKHARYAKYIESGRNP